MKHHQIDCSVSRVKVKESKDQVYGKLCITRKKIYFFSYLLQKAQQRYFWKSTLSKSIFVTMTRLCKIFFLLLCCSLMCHQAWSCTGKLLSRLPDTKIYTVPLTPGNTPLLTLCLLSPLDQYDMLNIGRTYGLTIKGYRQEGIWENNLTRLDGLTIEDVLDKLTSENFVSVD